MNNDRKKDQDEADNESTQNAPVVEPNPSGEGRQTQGAPSHGKQFEGGREIKGPSGERGVGRSQDKRTTNVETDDTITGGKE